MPTVNQNRCPQDHPCPCIQDCPVDAITQVGFNAPEIDMEKCIQCGLCTSYCRLGAIIPDQDVTGFELR
ncbi:4Fe-4S binding protein [Acidobacteriota bacterium]